MPTCSVLNLPSERFVAVALSILLATFGLYGCASKAQMARERARDKAVKNHTYSTDLDRVVEQARTLLSRKGYSIQDGEDDYVLTTGWREYDLDNPVGKKRKRYLVKTTGNQVILNYRTEQFSGGAWSATVYTTGLPRDLDMEYKLIKRVEPEDARAIKARADRAANQAKTSEGS